MSEISAFTVVCNSLVEYVLNSKIYHGKVKDLNTYLGFTPLSGQVILIKRFHMETPTLVIFISIEDPQFYSTSKIPDLPMELLMEIYNGTLKTGNLPKTLFNSLP